MFVITGIRNAAKIYGKKSLTNLSIETNTKVRKKKSSNIIILKSVNVQYNTLGHLDDGTNESSTKSLMFQVCIIFLYFL